MNLAKVAVVNVPLDERRSLVAEGRVSPLALIPPFSSLEEYPSAYIEIL
jgi:hypothetical protein